MRLQEPAGDLAVAAALASSVYDVPLPRDAVFIGELGLGGEIRTVSQVERRIAEAAKMGMKTAYVGSRGSHQSNRTARCGSPHTTTWASCSRRSSGHERESDRGRRRRHRRRRDRITRVGSAGELKQFRWVAGKPMLLHAVQTFLERADVALVVCVLPRAHAADPPPWLFQCDLDRLLVSTGGDGRGESVWNGLEDLPDEVTVVLIHDAARPLVTDATIDAVIAEARRGHGAIAALPVVDTLKEVDASGRIVRTVDRERLWRAQTPQGFPRA